MLCDLVYVVGEAQQGLAVAAARLVPLCHLALFLECLKLILDEVTSLGLVLAQGEQRLGLPIEADLVAIVSLGLFDLFVSRRRLDGDLQDYLSVWQRLLHHVGLLLCDRCFAD
jgi:hypothetical protein